MKGVCGCLLGILLFPFAVLRELLKMEDWRYKKHGRRHRR